MNAGLDGSNAGTALRASLLALNNPAKAQEKIMAGLGFSMQDSEGKTKNLSSIVGDLTKSMDGMSEADKVATLAKLVGTEAVSGFLALTKAGPTEIDKMSESLRNSGGASEEAAAKMKAGIGGSLENLSGAFETLVITIGDQLVPYVQMAATWLAGLAEKFTNLSDGTKKFLVIGTAAVGIFTGIVAAIGVVLMVVGGAISGLTAIAAAMGIAGGAAGLLSAVFAVLTGPIGITVAAIAGLIAIFVLAYKKVDWFREGVNKAWEAIKKATVIAFDAVKKVVLIAMEEIKQFAGDILSKLQAFWAEHGKYITYLVKESFGTIWETIKSVMGYIKGIFQAVWPIISGAVQIAWGLIKTIISSSLDIILGIVGTVMKVLEGDWKGAWDALKKIVTDVWDNIKKYLGGIDLAKIGKNIVEGLIKGISSMTKAVTDVVKNIADSIPEGIKKILGIHSPSRVLHEIGEFTGIGLANGIASTQAVNAKAMNELGGVITGVAKANAAEIAVINRTASAEQSAIAKKATATIAEIYAKAHDAKRKLTAAEVRKIAKIEDDADAQILANKKKHNAEIAKVDASTAKERLDVIKQFVADKKDLEEISLIDEVNIWRKAADLFKEGTDEKIAAQKQYQDALERVNDEIVATNEKYSKRMSDINEKLTNDIKAVNSDLLRDSTTAKNKLIADEERLNAEYAKALEDRYKSLRNFAGLFENFSMAPKQTGTELLSNLQSQVDGFKTWESEIAKLSSKAIDQGLLEELRDMGPDALPQLLALNSLTEDQLKRYSDLYLEKSALARAEAEEQLIGMKADTAYQINELRMVTNMELDRLNMEAQQRIVGLRRAANTELATLKDEWVIAIKSITTVTKDEFKTLTQIGKQAGQNLLNGLASMEGALVSQATAIAKAVNDALQATLGGSVSVAGYKPPSTSAGVSKSASKTSSSSTSGNAPVTNNYYATVDASSVKDFTDVVNLFSKQTMNRR